MLMKASGSCAKNIDKFRVNINELKTKEIFFFFRFLI